MVNKRLWIVFFLVVFLSGIASAEFNPERGVNYLVSRITNGGVENDIVKTAFSALFFKKIGGVSEAERAADFIQSKEGSNGCFPSTSCKVKDTAMAIIALANLNRDVGESLSFLNEAQSTGLGSNLLMLEVATSGSGNCTALFETNGQQNRKSFLINEGRFSSCGNNYFLDLNSNCLKNGLASSYPGTTIDIDCSSVSSSTVIGTLYKKGNDIFLGESFNSKVAKIVIDSGCYGVSSKSICNLDSSLFAGWALRESEADFNIIPFLKQNYDPNSPFHLALMYIITSDEIFLKALKEKQNANGGFDNSVSSTAFAVIALGGGAEAEKAMSFLKSKQNNDGSWNGNTLDTILSLIVLSDFITSDSIIRSTSPGISCDRDGVCETELGEDEDTCPQDCLGSYTPSTSSRSIEQGPCNDNGVCERDEGEDEINCPLDCVETETPSAEEPVIEDEESSSGIIIWIIVIGVILLAAFFALKKFKGGKKESKKENRFEFKPFTAQLVNKQQSTNKIQGLSGGLFKPVKQAKTKVESELEKSIEEAKKLLRK